MKYDPYVKRYISLVDYTKECYGGLPNESMLEEQWHQLPDHPEKLFKNMINPKAITRLSSHTYELPMYHITSNGAEDFRSEIIAFCKGSKDAPGHPGFFSETLIQLCADHLESVNVGHLQNDYTTAAVAHLKTALEILDERIKDREVRGVLQSYQK